MHKKEGIPTRTNDIKNSTQKPRKAIEEKRIYEANTQPISEA